MSLSLPNSIIFVVICLGRICHGWQTQAAPENLQNGQFTESPWPPYKGGKALWSQPPVGKGQMIAGRKTEFTYNPLKVLAQLFLLVSIAHAFNPPNSRALFPSSTPISACSRRLVLERQHRLGGHTPVMGQDSGAESLERKLEITRILQGPEHPETVQAMSNYAMKLTTVKRESEAELLLKEVLEFRRRVQGPEHQETMLALRNYANTLCDLGRDSEAEPLKGELLRLCTQVYGPEHPDSLDALRGYAGILLKLGQEAKAAPFISEALALITQALGPDLVIFGANRKKQTSKALLTYADALTEFGRHAEAAPLYEDALEVTRRAAGSEHQFMFNVLNKCAVTLIRIGREDEAGPFLKEILELTSKVNGPSLMKGMLDFRYEMLGSKHPETITAMQIYADSLTEIGRHAKAEPVRKELLESRKEILGPDHLDTLRALSSYVSTLNRIAGKLGLEAVGRRLRELQGTIADFESRSQQPQSESESLRDEAERLLSEVFDLRRELPDAE